MAFYPSLEDNYTTVPNEFMQQVFRLPMSREEIVVMLLFFRHTYGWKKERAFLQLTTILAETTLTEEEAAEALQMALDRGTILALPLGDDDSGRAYLLNTKENEQFLGLYGEGAKVEESREVFGVEEPASAALATSAPGGARRVPGRRDRFTEPPPEPAPFAPPPPRPSFAPPPTEPNPFVAAEPQLFGAEDEEPVFLEAPATEPAPSLPVSSLGDESGPETPPPDYLQLPYRKQTLAMLTRILGRWPTKDEAARLSELNAGDDGLIEAMSSLLSKTSDVYSSDLIVYEYESLVSQKRRTKRNEEAQIRRQEQQERQKRCARCAGLGYIFVGVNEIRECTCRKVED